MNIKLNGQSTEVKNNITITQLLEDLKLNPEITIVEQNGEILARDKYPCVTVNEKDTIELIRYMGGG